jgi:hypothetical protein
MGRENGAGGGASEPPFHQITMVQAPGSRYFSFLSAVFGLLANIDIGSESLR